MERSKVCMSAFFDDTPHKIPSLFDVSCHRRHPVLNLQLGSLRFQHSSFATGHIRTGRFLYHLIQQSKGLKLTTEVRFIIQQVMTANGVSADVLLYVSNGPGQTDVTPEKYRDTLRAHCMDHWDWSPIVNFAHDYFTYLGLSMYTTLGPPTGYRPSGSDVDSPRFQNLEEIEEMLRRFDATGHSDQEGMIKLVRERDGKKCLFTFNTRSPVVGRVTKLAHICPTKLANHENPLVYQAFAVFWNDEELTKRFATLVNSPVNCLLLSHDAHKNLEEMCWAMEAIENVDRGAWDYYFVKLGGRTFPYEPADRTRIRFGVEGERFKNDIPLPSPDLCNLRLAVTKVMRLSGAAEVVESWKDEYDEDPNAICSVLGHPYTDMVALEKLDEQFSSANS